MKGNDMIADASLHARESLGAPPFAADHRGSDQGGDEGLIDRR
jgi:hypothetical protein